MIYRFYCCFIAKCVRDIIVRDEANRHASEDSPLPVPVLIVVACHYWGWIAPRLTVTNNDGSSQNLQTRAESIQENILRMSLTCWIADWRCVSLVRVNTTTPNRLKTGKALSTIILIRSFFLPNSVLVKTFSVSKLYTFLQQPRSETDYRTKCHRNKLNSPFTASGINIHLCLTYHTITTKVLFKLKQRVFRGFQENKHPNHARTMIVNTTKFQFSWYLLYFYYLHNCPFPWLRYWWIDAL